MADNHDSWSVKSVLLMSSSSSYIRKTRKFESDDGEVSFHPLCVCACLCMEETALIVCVCMLM